MKIVQISMKVKPNLTVTKCSNKVTDRQKEQWEFTHFVGTNIKNMKIVQISMKVKPNLT